MDEIWMKPGDGSTGSPSGTQVAYATFAESLTPRVRDLEDGIEPGLGTRGQGLQEALATQARVLAICAIQVRRMAFANSLPGAVLLLAVGAWSVVPTPGTYRIVRS
jgi:hypothetical protein